MDHESVSHWIVDLREGDHEAAQHIWQRYFQKLVTLARQKLGPADRRMADEEDVALSAFDSFCRLTANGRYPQLQDRDQLWRLLFTITERKASDYVKHQRRQKRSPAHGAQLHLHSGPDGSVRSDRALEIEGREPTPDFAAQVAENVARLLTDLQDENLRQVALMKMEGHSNAEVAERMGCSTRTVKRKLQVIRAIWSEQLE